MTSISFGSFLDEMIKIAEANRTSGQIEQSKKMAKRLPKYLYHGSSGDFETLDNTGEGVHLTVAPGLASAFAIKRDDIVKGRSGKVRNAQKIWNSPLSALRKPVEHHRVAVLSSPRAKNPITPGEKGESSGYVYRVRTDKIKKHLYVNPPEPREIIFTGSKIPIDKKVPVRVTWETVHSPEIRGGPGTNTFARALRDKLQKS